MRVHLFAFVFALSILRGNSVSVPISHGNAGRVYTVKSSSLIHELHDDDRNTEERSDNSYDDPLVALSNNSTLTTASVLSQVIRGHDIHKTVDYLGHVENPGVVAEELENAAKYLAHQAGVRSGGDESEDLVRVLDGFVFFNSLYESIVRPGGGGKVTVNVEVIIHPWFTVDEERNELSVELVLVQNWNDSRLAYKDRLKRPDKIQRVTLTNLVHETNIWLPDTYVINEKRSYKHEVAPLRITSGGGVSKEQRMYVSVHCPFEKSRMFPFDSHKCFVNLTSFSWNEDQVEYKLVDLHLTDQFPDSLEFNGFRLIHTSVVESNFGQKSGIVVEFQLERVLFPYVLDYYVPLGVFCLVAIFGLIPGVGEGVAVELSYFMFGLMSVFMGLSAKEWGNARTNLDLYYVLCALTVFGTLIVNMFRSSISSKQRHGSSPESYEMDTDRSKTPQNGGSCSTTQTTRLWSPDNVLDDQDYDAGGTAPSRTTNRSFCTEFLKTVFRRAKSITWFICIRINDFSVSFLLGVFILWNFYYWFSG